MTVDIKAKALTPEVAEEFFTQQDGLEMDYIRASERSRKMAWRVSLMLGVCCFVESCAIASLAPMHTVEWRLVRMDDKGYDLLVNLDQAGQFYTDGHARADLDKYVRLRETFYDPEKEYNYDVVSLMSAPDEQVRYANSVKASNPNAPQNQFKAGGYRRVTIERATVLQKGLGQVAYRQEDFTDKGNVPTVTYWQATLSYSVNPKAKMKDSDRNKNLMGFQVLTYHTDQVAR